MANIFAGTEPPAWLRDVARPVERGATGQFLGTLAAGFINGLKRDYPGGRPKTNAEMTEKEALDKALGQEQKPPRKGFLQGYQEARMNQIDPMWRLKEQSYRADIASKLADTQADYALAKERERESADWAEDAPNVSPWITAAPDKRKDMPEPQVKSRKAMDIIQKQRESDDRYWTQKEAQRIREETSRLALENARRAADWESAVSAAPADVQADIYGLPNEGWIMDEKGVRRTPGRAALNRLNEWRASQKMPAWGLGKTDAAAALQEQKTEDRKELNTQQGTINATRDEKKFGYQQQLQTDRAEQQSQLLDKRIAGQQSLQEMKGEQAKDLETQRQAGKEKLLGIKQSTLDAIGKVNGNPKAYSLETQMLARSLEHAHKTFINFPGDEQALKMVQDYEAKFKAAQEADMARQEAAMKAQNPTASEPEPIGPTKNIGGFRVTPVMPRR